MSFTRLLGPVLALAAPACHSDDVVVGGGPIEVTQFSVSPNRALDILFVVDNSHSMLDKQIALANAFPRMLDVIAGVDGGLPDLHIGVVTSDMGTTSAASGEPTAGLGQPGNGGCAGRGDDGTLRQIDGMTARFLSDVAGSDGARVTNYTGELRDVFGALAQVGAGGCGFEQHLRAMQRAVENPLNAGFLRAEANLAVVILADEDDCSARTAALFGVASPSLGELTSFRCFAHGVTCDESTTSVGGKTGCRPDDESEIIASVAPFVAALRATKVDPRRVMVGAIIGDPEAVSVDQGTLPGGGVPTLMLAHACGTSTEAELADPGVRLAAFAEAFPGRPQVTSICGGNLDGPLGQLGTRARALVGDPCFDPTGLRDTSAAEPGVQPACEVSLDRGPTAPATTIPACTDASTDCFELVASSPRCATTPGHLEVRLRPAVEPAPDTWISVRCAAAMK